MLRILCAVGACLPLLGGCSGTSSAPEKLYDIKGKVVAIDQEKKTATLDHEDVPGLMRAMQMAFPVADAKFLEGLAAGDFVEGKLKVVEGKHVLTELHKTQRKTDASLQELEINANLAKLNSDDRKLAEQQRLCAVGDEPLGSMGVPIKLKFAEGSAFICCKSCEKEARKNESATLRKAWELKKKSP